MITFASFFVLPFVDASCWLTPPPCPVPRMPWSEGTKETLHSLCKNLALLFCSSVVLRRMNKEFQAHIIKPALPLLRFLDLQIYYCFRLLALTDYALWPVPISELFWKLWILQTVDGTSWMGDQPIVKPLRAQNKTDTDKAQTYTFMPLVGFEPRIPVLQRRKIFHALDRMTHCHQAYYCNFISLFWGGGEWVDVTALIQTLCAWNLLDKKIYNNRYWVAD
jgi:hypothetical protein